MLSILFFLNSCISEVEKVAPWGKQHAGPACGLVRVGNDMERIDVPL